MIENISLDKMYRTRDGREVDLRYTLEWGKFSVIGYISGIVQPDVWKRGGAYCCEEKEHPFDLIEVEVKKKKETKKEVKYKELKSWLDSGEAITYCGGIVNFKLVEGKLFIKPHWCEGYTFPAQTRLEDIKEDIESYQKVK